ncbi:MAG TPA: neutral zinc metallopeptidase [Gillisia sp.]|nr:neutral zinc metallopeptidase [Gillisia sp.]
MKWQGRRQSTNVDDRRGKSTGGKIAVGGGLIGLIFLAIQLFTGGDTTEILNQIQTNPGAATEERELTAEEIEIGEFTATVLADTEDIWNDIFAQHGSSYREPGMVLFTDAVQSACGGASSAVGPFYCPGDEKIYMDLVFFEELRTRFGAEGGDFAIAYVIAHEVGHHIQHLMGTAGEVRSMQQRLSQGEANELSVALELQADFYAGVWAHHNREYLEEGDIQEALSAASAVGDDAIQKRTSGRVVPDAFTHGTSEQRMQWFKKGYTTGDITQGDTFKGVR